MTSGIHACSNHTVAAVVGGAKKSVVLFKPRVEVDVERAEVSWTVTSRLLGKYGSVRAKMSARVVVVVGGLEAAVAARAEIMTLLAGVVNVLREEVVRICG